MVDRKKEKDKTRATEQVVRDTVNHPPHYNNGGMECIDYIKQVLTLEEFKGYCHGNLIKYQHRHEYKNSPIEDMEKAKWYLEKMIDTMKEIKK